MKISKTIFLRLLIISVLLGLPFAGMIISFSIQDHPSDYCDLSAVKNTISIYLNSQNICYLKLGVIAFEFLWIGTISTLILTPVVIIFYTMNGVFKKITLVSFLLSVVIGLFFTYIKVEINEQATFCAYEISDNENQRNITTSEANWKSGGEDCILLLTPVLGNWVFATFLMFSYFAIGILCLWGVFLAIKKIFL